MCLFSQKITILASDKFEFGQGGARTLELDQGAQQVLDGFTLMLVSQVRLLEFAVPG
jgi:hypothetical protein